MNEAAMSIMQDAGLPMGVIGNDTNKYTIVTNGKFKCRACNLAFKTKQ